MGRYIYIICVAVLLSWVLCKILIPILKRLKAGQNILVYVKEHEGKSGTPTMGGIAFILAAVIASFCFVRKYERSFVICIVIGLAYMIVGLLDDYLKRKHKENLGLRAGQKFTFQTLIAIFAAIYCYRAGLTGLYIPFINKSIRIGWGILPLSIFVFLATVNAVNLTDGLDGLAAGTCAPFFASLGGLILLQKGSASFSLVSFALTGALLAYLLFNSHPASIFMGDTGSLSLGGFAACIALFTGNALYVAIIGACFVFSVISVIIQVIYYKVTGGKRVFLMAPFHHHLQQKGFSETRISYAYATVTFLLGCVCLASVL